MNSLQPTSPYQLWNSFSCLLVSFYIWAGASFISNSLLSVHHIFAVLAFFLFLKEKQKIEFKASLWPLLLFSATLALSVFWNWESLAHPLKNLSKIKYFIIAALLGIQVNTHKNKLKSHLGSIFSLFILSYSIANLWGIIKLAQHELTNPIVEFRLGGFFGMVMSYAYTAVLPLSLILFLCLNPNVAGVLATTTYSKTLRLLYKRKILFFVLLLSLSTLYLTLTRGAILGALIIFPLLVFFKSKKWAVLLGVASITLIATAAALSLSNKDFGNRLVLQANHQGNSERLAQNKMGLMAFKENPLFGIGYRSFEEKGHDIKERNGIGSLEFSGHAHNNYLEILGGSGILSFACFLFWIFSWLIEITKIKEGKSLFLAFLAAFLIMGLFQSTVIDSEYMFTFLALYALSFTLQPTPLKA